MTDKIELANMTIAKEVAECLDVHYKGHAWGVRANVETGLVHVFNLNLSGQWGFVLHIDNLINDPSMKTVIMAGGELLERYNLSRSEIKPEEYMVIKFDFKGDAVQV